MPFALHLLGFSSRDVVGSNYILQQAMDQSTNVDDAPLLSEFVASASLPSVLMQRTNMHYNSAAASLVQPKVPPTQEPEFWELGQRPRQLSRPVGN